MANTPSENASTREVSLDMDCRSIAQANDGRGTASTRAVKNVIAKTSPCTSCCRSWSLLVRQTFGGVLSVTASIVNDDLQSRRAAKESIRNLLCYGVPACFAASGQPRDWWNPCAREVQRGGVLRSMGRPHSLQWCLSDLHLRRCEGKPV